MLVKIKQLKEKRTGTPFVPVTHWDAVSGKTNATQSAAGLMSPTDKNKVDNIPSKTSDLQNDSKFVSSLSIETLWKGTQRQYDLIVSKDPKTWYIIVAPESFTIGTDIVNYENGMTWAEWAASSYNTLGWTLGQNDDYIHNSTDVLKIGNTVVEKTDTIDGTETYSWGQAVSLISFTIVVNQNMRSYYEVLETYQCQAELGMTLGQWLDSQYNNADYITLVSHDGDYAEGEDYEWPGTILELRVIENAEYVFKHNEGEYPDYNIIQWYADEQETTEIGDDATITNNGTLYCNDYTACLLGETLVTMADGSTKQLKDIVVGDEVRSLDFETNQVVNRKVIFSDAAINKKAQQWDEWEFSDGTIIKTTHRHEFYNVEAGKFKYLDEWQIGEHTYKEDGTTPELIQHTIHDEVVNHYKITLEGSTNYFANGLLTGDRYCVITTKLA